MTQKHSKLLKGFNLRWLSDVWKLQTDDSEGRRDNNVQTLENEGDLERLIPNGTSRRTEGWNENGELWNGLRERHTEFDSSWDWVWPPCPSLPQVFHETVILCIFYRDLHKFLIHHLGKSVFLFLLSSFHPPGTAGLNFSQ